MRACIKKKKKNKFFETASASLYRISMSKSEHGCNSHSMYSQSAVQSSSKLRRVVYRAH